MALALALFAGLEALPPLVLHFRRALSARGMSSSTSMASFLRFGFLALGFALADAGA
eukprot:CAMPEP_0202390302 /NCGR_PEP_ID=MMETSP1127-20130417/87904_1 /ASSEMBLY_ACC=CAM_ASM_000462 /TAXON_ID=3047 /ORGANISM="Dunaliella tertiolecta, Strain CCMP1320" /LENGTH=56 /DNA_ID=CAMNT_0048992433 /DNA_START=131 /DNA_END=298 /DNA_ORIENTATION=-